MKLETVTVKNDNIVSSDMQNDGMRIRQSGIAKVLWCNLTREVPDSQPESEHRTTIPKIESLISKDLYQGFWFNGDGR